MVQVDVMIAGGGVAGLLLARALRARGRSVLVANDPARPAAAQAAVGLLNPVLGKRFTIAWQAATALPVARAHYTAIAAETGTALFQDRPIVRLLRDATERTSWESRAAGIAAAGFEVAATTTVPDGFRPGEHGAIIIRGAGLVDAWLLIDVLRRQLAASGSYVDVACRPEDVVLHHDHVTWQGDAGAVEAGALVLTGGAADVAPQGSVTYYVTLGRGDPLAIRPVKGESLLVHAPALAPEAVVVSGHFLAPRGDGYWICGATQEPDVADGQASVSGRAELESFLRAHVSVPWTIVDHRAGVRPTVPDQRPLVGRWISSAPVYVLNGLGSRGFALGPWLAELLADHLVTNIPLPAEIPRVGVRSGT